MSSIRMVGRASRADHESFLRSTRFADKTNGRSRDPCCLWTGERETSEACLLSSRECQWSCTSYAARCQASDQGILSCLFLVLCCIKLASASSYGPRFLCPRGAEHPEGAGGREERRQDEKQEAAQTETAFTARPGERLPTTRPVPFAELGESAEVGVSRPEWIKSRGLFGRNSLWRIKVTGEDGATVRFSGVPDLPLLYFFHKFSIVPPARLRSGVRQGVIDHDAWR